MKKLDNFKSFDDFILEGSTRRAETIEKVVKKLKMEFGKTKEDFLDTARNHGVGFIKNFILKNLQPYLEQLERPELFKNGFDYDGMLAELVGWLLVELEVEKMKKTEKKANE